MWLADTNPGALDYGRSIGVSAVSTSITHFEDEQLDLTVDFAGVGTTTAEAVRTVRPGARRLAEVTERPGGRVVQVGITAASAELDLLSLTLNEVELLGSMGGTHHDCEEYLQTVSGPSGRTCNRDRIRRYRKRDLPPPVSVASLADSSRYADSRRPGTVDSPRCRGAGPFT